MVRLLWTKGKASFNTLICCFFNLDEGSGNGEASLEEGQGFFGSYEVFLDIYWLAMLFWNGIQILFFNFGPSTFVASSSTTPVSSLLVITRKVNKRVKVKQWKHSALFATINQQLVIPSVDLVVVAQESCSPVHVLLIILLLRYAQIVHGVQLVVVLTQRSKSPPCQSVRWPVVSCYY
jgi:hypothetical protein